jgi:hypothetical protein
MGSNQLQQNCRSRGTFQRIWDRQEKKARIVLQKQNDCQKIPRKQWKLNKLLRKA